MPGTARSGVGVNTSSKEEASEAPADKERPGLAETLLRVSSEDYSDFTVMAYTGITDSGAARSGGGDGGMHSGDELSSPGSLAIIAGSPPLLEHCQVGHTPVDVCFNFGMPCVSCFACGGLHRCSRFRCFADG